MSATAQKAEQAQQYQVGKVQMQQYSGTGLRSGHGFVISNARSVPLVSMTYSTPEEAEEARNLVVQAIQNAIDIVAQAKL